MPLELSEVQTWEEFRAVGALMYEAYETPFNAFWETLKGENEAECTARYWAWHAAPGSHWLQVKDTETGKVIGAAEWIIHEKNPFENGNTIPEGTWWTEENMKNITDQAMHAFFSRRPVTMSRPHLLINICCVSKAQRRRGAGRMLMDWGCKIADEMDLEAFVESTTDGIHLYESVGFTRVEPFVLDPQLPETKSGEDAERWKELKAKSFAEPYVVWLMWRPKGGKFITGETKYSWEE